MFNTATIARLGRAALSGFVLVALSASPGEASYGPKITIGARYQQWTSTLSSDGINEGQCNGSVCRVLFQRASKQKALIINHVSCHLCVNAGGPRYGAIYSRKGQQVRDNYTILTPVNTTASNWALTSPMTHLIEANGFPIIVFYNSASANIWSAECNISGQLKNP